MGGNAAHFVLPVFDDLRQKPEWSLGSPKFAPNTRKILGIEPKVDIIRELDTSNTVY